MSMPQPQTITPTPPIQLLRSHPAPDPGALPRMLTPFLGREALVAAVVERLQDPTVRLLTLIGPGGVGKTRLAVRVAEVAQPAYPGGILFVPLAPVVDPTLVLPAIGEVLGLSDGGERPIVERLAHAVAGRRLLLVLDNLEQVIAAAPQLGDLLRAAPPLDLTLLVTSRAALRIDGEHEQAVPPLALPGRKARGSLPAGETEAVRFFLARAHAVRPDLEPTASEMRAVREIVLRLDGLPLALELAAARTKVLSPEALLARLSRQLHVLTGGPQDRPARQRTMREAIAWSHGLLTPAEQQLFRRLALFRGGFSLDDAEAILGNRGDLPAGSEAPMDVLDGVSSLADQSLLTISEADDGSVRFRMLETIREFGLEQLEASGEADTIQARFAAHWRAEADETWAHTSRMEGLNLALEPLERNQDNVRAALDWLESHDPAGAAGLAGALFWYWYIRGHHAEALRRLRRVLASPEGVVPAPLLPRVLLAAGTFSHFQSDVGRAVPLLESALAGWRAEGDAWGTGYTLLVLGVIAEDTERYERARELLAEAVEWLTSAGDTGSASTARYHLAVVAFGSGDLDAAEALLRGVIGDESGPVIRVAAWAIHLRGLLAHARGDPARALRDFQDALRRFREVRHPAGMEEALAGAAVATAAARMPVSVRLWAAAERLTDERGDTFQPPEREVYAAAMADLRATLGEAAFAAEREAGRSWSEAEAVEVALSLEIVPAPAARPEQEPRLAGLSGREREVLRLVATGWTNDRIAGELFLSPRTVQTHLTNIFRKIDVENRTEATRFALGAGLT